MIAILQHTSKHKRNLSEYQNPQIITFFREEVETTPKVVKKDWSGWNQGVKWLGENRTSVSTLVPRASHDDKWWYQDLNGL
jgi:hypothetical protein